MKSRSMSSRIEDGKMLEAAKLQVDIALGVWRGRRLFLAVTIKGQVILRKTYARHQLTITQTLVTDKELKIVRTREIGCPWFADASLPSGNRLSFPLPASRHSRPTKLSLRGSAQSSTIYPATANICGPVHKARTSFVM